MKAVWWWIGYGVWGLVLALVLGVQGGMAADQAQTTRVSIAAMYVAFFERAPDDDGLTFWEADAAQSGLSAGALMRKLATGFAHHPSFTERYGALDNGQFVDAIYRNVGGALPDAEGRQFWLNALESQSLTRPEFVADFVFGLLNITVATLDQLLAEGELSAEEYAGALQRKNRLTYRAEVGLAFTVTLGSAANFASGTDPLDPQSLAADPVYQAAQKIVSGVSAAVATRDGALAYLATNPSIAAINDASLANIFPPPTLTPGSGRLHVTLEPTAAVQAGAQWRRTNTTQWRDSDTTETGILVGGHTVEFKVIPNWTAPSNAAVSITAGQTTTLTRGYEPEATDPVDPIDPSPAATGRLNDTGIDWSGHATDGNAATCDPAHPAGQDCHYGRDAQARAGTLTKVGGGNAGFDFTKISNSGAVLPASATLGSGPNDWACTRDNVTGLIWEVKVNDSSHLRHQDHTYTWYDPNSPDRNPGVQDGGNCFGSVCDTQGFVQAVNQQGLCGATDWRMPTRRELQGIVDYGQHRPAIDAGYFPNTPINWPSNWSGSPDVRNLDNAWGVSFVNGGASNGYRSNDCRVRLVRGGQ